MPEEKGLGSKLLGLFVESNEKERPGEEGVDTSGQSAAELVAQLAQSSTPRAEGPKAAQAKGPPAPAPAAPAVTVPKPAGPVAPAAVDFDAVFRQAGVDAGDLDRVRKAEELLKALPEGTPAEVKRQIVEASLKAFGFDVTKIVNAANTQLKALDTFVKVHEQQTQKATADALQQISKLEESIISLKVEVEKRAAQLAATTSAAEVRRDEVRRVLGFFGAP